LHVGSREEPDTLLSAEFTIRRESVVVVRNKTILRQKKNRIASLAKTHPTRARHEGRKIGLKPTIDTL
jgi:hypothetical protein